LAPSSALMVGRTRAPGRPLSAAEIDAFKPFFSEELLSSVILHEAHVPWWLPRRFEAVTLKSRIFIRQGAYYSATPAGLELLAHELTHVRQFADGMSYSKYLWSAVRGHSKSIYELQAFENAAAIRKYYDA
jgi:hypothetical protein